MLILLTTIQISTPVIIGILLQQTLQMISFRPQLTHTPTEDTATAVEDEKFEGEYKPFITPVRVCVCIFVTR